jgi:hypothetical protein
LTGIIKRTEEESKSSRSPQTVDRLKKKIFCMDGMKEGYSFGHCCSLNKYGIAIQKVDVSFTVSQLSTKTICGREALMQPVRVGLLNCTAYSSDASFD